MWCVGCAVTHRHSIDRSSNQIVHFLLNLHQLHRGIFAAQKTFKVFFPEAINQKEFQTLTVVSSDKENIRQCKMGFSSLLKEISSWTLVKCWKSCVRGFIKQLFLFSPTFSHLLSWVPYYPYFLKKNSHI